MSFDGQEQAEKNRYGFGEIIFPNRKHRLLLSD